MLKSLVSELCLKFGNLAFKFQFYFLFFSAVHPFTK